VVDPLNGEVIIRAPATSVDEVKMERHLNRRVLIRRVSTVATVHRQFSEMSQEWFTQRIQESRLAWLCAIVRRLPTSLTREILDVGRRVSQDGR
jgi:hypothetical protein